MAVKKPLVLSGGAMQELQSGDTLPGAVPAGGTTDQVLAKNSNADGDLKWATAGGGAVTSVNTQTGDVVLDAGDIAEVTDKRYMTDAQETKLDALPLVAGLAKLTVGTSPHASPTNGDLWVDTN